MGATLNYRNNQLVNTEEYTQYIIRGEFTGENEINGEKEFFVNVSFVRVGTSNDDFIFALNKTIEMLNKTIENYQTKTETE